MPKIIKDREHWLVRRAKKEKYLESALEKRAYCGEVYDIIMQAVQGCAFAIPYDEVDHNMWLYVENALNEQSKILNRYIKQLKIRIKGCNEMLKKLGGSNVYL